jgi:RNA polymerase sigma-70 factor, ECF subfamily
VNERDRLVDTFEEHRPRLRAVAYRMLGSVSEAEDAVQETWLRVSRADTTAVENRSAWLNTVVARVCLNLLRSRRAHREDPLDGRTVEQVMDEDRGPEQEALLAHSVGLALLVVLDTLRPAERLAFVLHDMFDLPFDDIAPIVGRSTVATRQLASRARRRVRGPHAVPDPDPDLTRQRRVVEAYLAATRSGSFGALVELLDPDVVLRADRGSGPLAEPWLIRGAQAVANGALASAERARFAEPALVDGVPGLVMALRGRLVLVLAFTFFDGAIITIDVIGDRELLKRLAITVLDQDGPRD